LVLFFKKEREGQVTGGALMGADPMQDAWIVPETKG
jgi:hypothetical protein